MNDKDALVLLRELEDEVRKMNMQEAYIEVCLYQHTHTHTHTHTHIAI